MPLVEFSKYKAPLLMRNAHLMTVYASMVRRVAVVPYKRERISTPDEDFLDLDWYCSDFKRLLIISHGLEGSTHSPHVRALAMAAKSHKWDVLAWNHRSCSGEPNLTPRLYHSGSSDDLESVVTHVLRNRDYSQIALAGYSLGGNVSLKFLGEQTKSLDARLIAAGLVSVPCDLASCADAMSKPINRLYLRDFLKNLRGKLEWKHKQFPDRISLTGFDQIKSFRHYDERYTAPMHGFESADDYYRRCSSLPLIDKIKTPTLILNAQDDSFLSPVCHPIKEADRNPFVSLEMPKRGGHVGFVRWGNAGISWAEERILQFLTEVAEKTA